MDNKFYELRKSKNSQLKSLMVFSIFISFLLLFLFANTSAQSERQSLMVQTSAPKYIAKPFGSKYHLADGTIIDRKKSGVVDTTGKVKDDTTKNENRIVSIIDSGEQFKVKIELIENDKEISINVYNLLGKNVMEVYRGIPPNSLREYNFNSSELSNGVYLLQLRGHNFSKTRKFIVSR
ncbi:MAG: hypothetical protein QG635_180 [Bacteroidota bacterium]|nr:hypothetical protein [Bacteroidota bacterium]